MKEIRNLTIFGLIFLVTVNLGVFDEILLLGKNQIAVQDSVLFKQCYKSTESLKNKAEIFHKAEIYDSAIYYYEKSSEIYRINQQWEEYFYVANRLVDNLWSKCENRKGINLAKTNLNLAEKHLPTQHIAYAEACYQLARFYHHDYFEYDSAKFFYNRSEQILKESIHDSIHNQLSIRLMQQLGEFNEKLGFYEDASEYLEKALLMENEMHSIQTKNRSAIYNTLGSIHLRLASYQQALIYYQQALTISNELYQDSNPFFGSFNINIGLAYEGLGYYSKAIECFRLSEAYWKESNKPNGLAVTYHNLSTVFLKNNMIDSASQQLNKILILLGEKPHVISRLYPQLGIVRRMQGREAEAYSFLRRGLEEKKRIFGDKHPEVAEIFIELAILYDQTDEIDKALEAIQNALISNSSKLFVDTHHGKFTKADSYLNSIIAIETLNLKCQLLWNKYLRTNDQEFIELAQNSTEIVDTLVSGLRKSKINLQDKMNLSKLSGKSYAIALDIQYEFYKISNNDKYIRNIFEIAERSKSSNLYLTLLDRNSKHFAGIPDSLLIKDNNMKINLTNLESRLLDVKGDDLTISDIEGKIFSLKLEHKALIETFSNLYPKYHRLKYSTKTVSIQEVQSELLKPNQTMIEYVLGDTICYIFAISKGCFEVKTIIRDSIFNEQLEIFRNSLCKPNLVNHSKSDYQRYTSAAHSLYQYIIAPVDSLIKGKDLIIVPDGELALIPFEALLTNDANSNNIDYKTLPYLIKQHAISYANSATLLYNEKQNAKALEDTSNGNILAFAPSFENNLTAYNTEDTVRSGLGSLSWTNEEVNVLSGYFDSQIYLNSEATERKFRQEASKYSIIHIASHGLVDDENPMYSKIAFAADVSDTLNDGYLHTFELYNTELNADMAVLSACNTGYGKVLKGEGVLNLARGFFYAGCKSVVMSLWVANDKSTSTLMGDFYKYLADGQPKSNALQNAKLNYLNNSEGLKAHPYYWSQFILSGNTEPLSRPNHMSLMKIGGYLILLLIVAYTLFLNRRRLSNYLKD